MTNDQNTFSRRISAPEPSRYEPRIAPSRFNFVFAGILGAIAVFAGLAGAGGSQGATGFAVACAMLALSLLLWAVINTYVRKIELRLIDIQKAIETK